MKPVKILHTADLHLGAELSYLGSGAEARRYEILSAFKNMTDFCREKNVEICLIAGDLFDSNRAGAVFAAPVLEYISAAAGTQFLYAAGNHDPLDASSPFFERQLPENLTVFGTEFETKEFPELCVRVTGKSFRHSSMPCESFRRVLPDDGWTHILLLHADLGADAASPYNPISRDFISQCGADYLALGHIHKRTGVARVENTFLAYPGCPEGQGFDEEGVKGAYFGEVGKGICELSFVRFCKRLHCVQTVELSDAVSAAGAAELILAKLKAEYGDSFGDNLYKLILTGMTDNASALKTAELISLLQSRLYFVKIRNRLKPRYDIDSLKNEVSLKGLFVKNMCGLLEEAPENEKEKITAALYLGLSAFDSEVAYNED